MTNFLNDIIKEKDTINFRGISIGDELSKVVEVEGNDFKKKIGSMSHYKYFFEIGEMEELEIIYGFSTETNRVNRIVVSFMTYPKYYWEESGGKDINEFLQLMETGRIQPYTKVLDETKENVKAHFLPLLGTPKIVERKEEVFNKPYHQLEQYRWDSEDTSLIMQSYLNDKSGAIKKICKLTLLPVTP